MRLLARSGQRSAALWQYETCRHTLADELGVEPHEETTAPYERIRTAGAARLHNLPDPLALQAAREALDGFLSGVWFVSLAPVDVVESLAPTGADGLGLQLTQNLDKFPAKDQPIVVYCGVGHRGGIAMMALQLLGYTNVKSLSGGFNAWKAGNFPIVKQ